MSELSYLFYAGLETAINQSLALDSSAFEKMQCLQDQVIGFELRGINTCFYLKPSPNKMLVLSQYDQPDCLIKGTPWALAKMSDNQASSQALFAGDVEITGSTALAHNFGKFLASINIDWQEHLSHITGDLIAHKIAGRWKKHLTWAKSTGHTFAMDIEEYMHEEIRLLPAREEVNIWLHDIDSLRDDVERLSARIERLRGLHLV